MSHPNALRGVCEYRGRALCRGQVDFMPEDHDQSLDASRVLAVILGGGRGTRLFPLTRERAKPAVPLAGKYRLVDIPISNCINAGIKRMYLLTQFNSASLHRHVSQSYKFDHFTRGFVEVLAAEQTLSGSSWYQGTADAVRQDVDEWKQEKQYNYSNNLARAKMNKQQQLEEDTDRLATIFNLGRYGTVFGYYNCIVLHDQLLVLPLGLCVPV